VLPDFAVLSLGSKGQRLTFQVDQLGGRVTQPFTLITPGQKNGSTPVGMVDVVPIIRARCGLRMSGQGDLQDEHKEQQAFSESASSVH
jgi:hypothetical protein